MYGIHEIQIEQVLIVMKRTDVRISMTSKNCPSKKVRGLDVKEVWDDWLDCFPWQDLRKINRAVNNTAITEWETAGTEYESIYWHWVVGIIMEDGGKKPGHCSYDELEYN